MKKLFILGFLFLGACSHAPMKATEAAAPAANEVREPAAASSTPSLCNRIPEADGWQTSYGTVTGGFEDYSKFNEFTAYGTVMRVTTEVATGCKILTLNLSNIQGPSVVAEVVKPNTRYVQVATRAKYSYLIDGISLGSKVGITAAVRDKNQMSLRVTTGQAVVTQ